MPLRCTWNMNLSFEKLSVHISTWKNKNIAESMAYLQDYKADV